MNIHDVSLAALALALGLAVTGCGGDNGAAGGSSSSSGGGSGSATITIDGEPFAVESVRCGSGPGFYQMTAEGPGHTWIRVRFSQLHGNDPSFHQGGNVSYNNDLLGRDPASRDGEIAGDFDHAIGTAVMYEDPHAPEGERGAEQVVEVDIRC